MRLPLRFHELAEGELNEAAAYYARARLGLGEAFLAEVQHAVETLAGAPLAGQTVHQDVRWCLVTRCPYCIYYRVCSDHIRVLAIGHQRRRPFYWRGRR